MEGLLARVLLGLVEGALRPRAPSRRPPQLLSGACRENSLEECALELYFMQDMEVLGKVTTHELKEGGEELRVTEENKEEYIM